MSVHETDNRLAALLLRACSMLASAFAAGLAAHLLGTNLSHDGSFRDLLLLAAALGISALLGGSLRSTASIVSGIAAASLCVSVGWLFLEDPSHVQIAQVVATLFALFPILCALLSAVLLLARASIAFASAVAELVLRSFSACCDTHSVSFVPETQATAPVQDTGPRLFLRRGPPLALMAVTPSA